MLLSLLQLQSCPPHPGLTRAQGHFQNGFKRDKLHAPRFSLGKYQQVLPAFPSAPPCAKYMCFLPTSERREGDSAVTASKAPEIPKQWVQQCSKP